MSLEIIVRPASSVPVLKSQKRPTATASEDDAAYIEWGSGSLSLTERSSVYNKTGSGGGDRPLPYQRLDESNRTTHIVRVTNPNDPDVWVDVEVIDSITFFGLSGLWEYRFNNTL